FPNPDRIGERHSKFLRANPLRKPVFHLAFQTARRRMPIHPIGNLLVFPSPALETCRRSCLESLQRRSRLRPTWESVTNPDRLRLLTFSQYQNRGPSLALVS